MYKIKDRFAVYKKKKSIRRKENTYIIRNSNKHA